MIQLILIMTAWSSPIFAQAPAITIRTEEYPRRPYSGATYYIYESAGRVICTKLKVCDKFDNCTVDYKPAAYKAEEDVATGEPYGQTSPMRIPEHRLSAHECLRQRAP